LLVTYRGVVYPAQCDAMGHMNTPHYVAAFDQAMWHLVASLGFRAAWIKERDEGWADVRYVIDYKSELRAGELFHVESGIRKIGRSSLVSRHAMVRTDGGEVAAELEMTSVYFDLKARVSKTIPDAIRVAVEVLASVAEEKLP
jgi:acyl-CoA thioester hydrolase